MNEQQRALKNFLRTHLYRHYLVLRMSAKAQRIISELFGIFMADSRLLPPQFQQNKDSGESLEYAATLSSKGSIAEAGRARAVADYIAGMTDRYAIREHRRIFAVEEVSESL
jgi:dGTPase